MIELNPLECALNEADALRGLVVTVRAENVRLHRENAKLRELVLDMLLYYAMPGAPDYKREAGLLERAHEMGIEVSE